MTAETFKDKAVIVTGASSGIGRALALQLADEGAWLALAARDAERLGLLAAECQQRGAKAIAAPTDVADEAQCRALIEKTQQAFGRIDMLVNCAGIGVASKLEDLPDLRLFKRLMDVNFYGTVHCTFHALPHIIESRGRIVNVSSLAGVLAIPFNTSYVASKFAINGFSESLRMELTNTGVNVTVICPYWVVSEFHERNVDKDGRPWGRAGRKIYSARTMTAERCAQITLEAARRRKRQVLMGPGRMGAWLKLITPSLTDGMATRALRRPKGRRAADS